MSTWGREQTKQSSSAETGFSYDSIFSFMHHCYLAGRPEVLLYDSTFFFIHQNAMVVMVGHLTQGQRFRRDGQQAAFHGRHLQTNTRGHTAWSLELAAWGLICFSYSAYRSTCRCVYVHDTLDIRPCGVNGRMKGEARLVDPKVCASSVHYLTLKVYLHLVGI